MSTLHYKTSPATTYGDLLARSSEDEFSKEKQDLKRSSLAVLEYWGREPDLRLEHLCAGIQAPCRLDSRLRFEHEVKSASRPGDGDNRASCTDLLIENDVAPIAVEGKRTEPAYDTVEKWLGEQPTQNKQNVLEHWVGMFGSYAPNLNRGLVSSCQYQTIHRCASACYEARRQNVDTAWLVYEVFDPGNAQQDFREELKNFSDMLGARVQIEIWLHEVELQPTEHHASTIAGIEGVSDRDERPDFLRQQMKLASLYDFPSDSFTRI